jgi:hypothetical protein
MWRLYPIEVSMSDQNECALRFLSRFWGDILSQDKVLSVVGRSAGTGLLAILRTAYQLRELLWQVQNSTNL